jgi:hypothetical protein
MVAAVAGLERGQHVEAQRPGRHREQQGDLLVQLGPGPRDERHRHRPHGRDEDQRGEDREVGGVSLDRTGGCEKGTGGHQKLILETK